MSRLTTTTLTRIGTAAGIRSVSRRKLVDVAKTMTIVVPLTVLIWVYAERAQLKSDTVNVTLGFRLSDSALIATLAEPADGRATLNVSGPLGQIQQLRSQLDTETVRHHIEVVLPQDDASVGPHTIDLVRVLNEEPLIAKSGVTVLKEGSIPLKAEVNVDRIVTKDATVVRPGSLPQGFENVTFDPPVVEFSGPAAAIEAAFPAETPSVTVDISGVENQLSIVGRSRKVTVPLVMPAGSRLTAKVQQVTMTFDLSSQEIADTIPSVPLEVRRPVGQDGQTRVTVGRGDQVGIYNVHIRGPADKVRECVNGTGSQRITAVIALSADDRGGRDIPKKVDFINVPTGVKIEREPYEVTVSVNDVRDSNAADR